MYIYMNSIEFYLNVLLIKSVKLTLQQVYNKWCGLQSAVCASEIEWSRSKTRNCECSEPTFTHNS